MNRAPLICSILISSAISFAQDRPDSHKPPATKLEAFQSRTGVVLIRGYSTVRTLSGLGGQIGVDARECRDGSNPNSSKTAGVSIAITETSRLERDHTSYIDVDEIESLVKGIEYISQSHWRDNQAQSVRSGLSD